MIRVLVIDDHPLVAGGVSAMLQGSHYADVIAAATTGADGLEATARHQPHVVLLDISLPDEDGLYWCQQLAAQHPGVKIIGLTSTNEAGIIAQFLHKGGHGYLLKNMDRDELLEAIDTVLAGRVYLSKAASQTLLQQFRSTSSAVASVPLLTRREQEILQLLADGLSGPQIAEQLSISHYTVETHRKNLLQKLKASNTPMLLKQARHYRLLP